MVLGDRLGDEVFARRQFRRCRISQISVDAVAARRRRARLQARRCRSRRISSRIRAPRSAPAIPTPGSAKARRTPASSAVARVPARRRSRATVRAIAASTPPARSIHLSILVALADRVADHLPEGLIGGDDDGRGKRLAERAVGLAEASSSASSVKLVEKLLGRGLVEHREARADIGLEGKLMQQPRAEGVDGLHLQPARRFQRRGEQPARARALRRVGFARVDRVDLGVERGVVQRRPFARAAGRRGSPYWRRRPW